MKSNFRKSKRPAEAKTSRTVQRKGDYVQRMVRSFWNGGEVRLNEDMTVDEVVARGVGVHIEQMDDDHWWMSIDGKQGRRMVLNFFRKGKSIRLTVEDDGYHSSGVCEGFKTPNDPSSATAKAYQ